MPVQNLSQDFINNSRKRFTEYRILAEMGMAQIDDRAFFLQPSTESNSIALIVKHMAGNLASRWTDFLATDGEKPSRMRDNEFLIELTDSRVSLMERWTSGYQILDTTLASLQPDDLSSLIAIRGEKLMVMDAILRALSHSAGHCGQIIFLSKMFADEKWVTLSIPRKK